MCSFHDDPSTVTAAELRRAAQCEPCPQCGALGWVFPCSECGRTEPPCIAGDHYPNEAGTACYYCGLAAEVVAPDELAAAFMQLCVDCGEPWTAEGSGDGSGDPQHTFCDLCGMAEHPADLTPDWNGETGNHRSCESGRPPMASGSTWRWAS